MTSDLDWGSRKFLCGMNNLSAKEYIYANNILGTRFLQFIQRKDENIPPDINVTVRREIVNRTFDV